MKRKALSVLLAGTMAAALLVGCGGRHDGHRRWGKDHIEMGSMG